MWFSSLLIALQTLGLKPLLGVEAQLANHHLNYQGHMTTSTCQRL